MALIECPECKKEISDKATSCPHCGFPMSPASPVSLSEDKPAPDPVKSEKLYGIITMLVILVVGAGIVMYAMRPQRREMTEYTYNTGMKALTACDEAIKGNLNEHAAHDIMQNCYYELRSDDIDDEGASFVASHILECQIGLTGWGYEKSNENYKKLVEDRNKLASDLGEKSIKE